MNTPNKVTENVEEGELIEIQENFKKININKSQSSKEFFYNYNFKINFSAESELNFETKFDEFIGDSEDSTEISLIVSNLCLSSSSSTSSNNNNNNSSNTHSCEINHKPESEADSENLEILHILNLKRSRQILFNKNFACEGNSKKVNSPLIANNNTKKGLLPVRPIAVKKISLAGRVLKGFDSAVGSSGEVSSSPDAVRPERSSNPIFKNANVIDSKKNNLNFINNNLNEIDNSFSFFKQFQLNKF